MRRTLAVLGSLIIPGCGHAVLGRTWRAAFWFALAFVAWVLTLLPHASGLIAFMTVRLACAVDAGAVAAPVRSDRITVPLASGMFLGPIAISVIMRLLLIEGFKVPQEGMMPTLLPGDHVFIKKWGDAGRGDLVVFVYPKDPNVDLVQRIVAVEGNEVAVRDGALYLDGIAVQQREVGAELFEETIDGHTYRTLLATDAPSKDFDAFVVPPGHVFVMGDNRNHSFDSRAWGPVPRENIKGVPYGIWWSSGSPEGLRWSRIGRLE